MKNAIILHGTGDTSQSNWFPWLKKELEKENWKVWVPDLPQANKPNIERYNKFLFSHKDFKLDKNTVLIGHSSGAVAILGLLQELAEDVIVDRAILIGAFQSGLGWDALKEIAQQVNSFDYEKIKKHVREIIFIHADNDPYVPLEQPEEMAKKLGAEIIVLEGQAHFSANTNPYYKKFPYLFELITQQD